MNQKNPSPACRTLIPGFGTNAGLHNPSHKQQKVCVYTFYVARVTLLRKKNRRQQLHKSTNYAELNHVNFGSDSPVTEEKPDAQ